MKIVKKICLVLLFTATGIVGGFLLITGWFYVTCPVYFFEEPEPFTGNKLYNPYQNMVDGAWMKSVFHLHTKSWMGLTNGENTFREVTDVYRQLNYDVVAISDYMSINRNKTANLPYIPVYEHGYNIKKTHQLALGADRVLLRDYFFWQNLHHKQHIIDLMKKNSVLVAVNHPTMRSSYPPDNFKYLRGYDLFEVQNGTHLSEKAWDVALSNGHPVWLIANDDAHTVNNPARLQREVTFINVPPSNEQAHILKYLSQGAAFGVHFPRKSHSTMDDKMQEAGTVSFPATIQVNEDTLLVVWRQMMQQIEFIGDNGKVLKTVTDSDSVSYVIRPEDSYVRVKLTSPENLVYYLNPVVRYQDDVPVKHLSNRVDKWKTFLKRILFAIISGTMIVYFFKKFLH